MQKLPAFIFIFIKLYTIVHLNKLKFIGNPLNRERDFKMEVVPIGLKEGHFQF